MKIVRYHIILTLFLVFFLTPGCENNEKEIPAPTIHLKMPEAGYELEVGDSIVLFPKITYDYRSRYQWYHNGNPMGTTLTFLHRSFQLGSDLYGFVVKTPSGTDSIGIPVNTIILVNLSDIDLPDNVNVGLDLPAESPWFNSKGILFPVNAESELQWTGFAISNRTSQATNATDIFSAYLPADSKTKTKNNFFIYQQSPSSYLDAIRFEDGKNHLVGSASVCNSTITYLVIKYGTEDIKRFGGESNNDPDWFLLTFEGYDNAGNYTGKVDFYLADYRFDNNRRNYIISNWTTVDLTPLGEVNRIALNLTSSVRSSGGAMLTPPFVCIDNIKVLN